ncbi:hypothetical protein TI01_1611 [Lysobacter sp. A03]|nr:hypothetical protein TI01_1611 [Lysobacter sp. A03]
MSQTGQVESAVDAQAAGTGASAGRELYADQSLAAKNGAE